MNIPHFFHSFLPHDEYYLLPAFRLTDIRTFANIHPKLLYDA